MMHFWQIAWCYYTVIAVVFHYYIQLLCMTRVTTPWLRAPQSVREMPANFKVVILNLTSHDSGRTVWLNKSGMQKKLDVCIAAFSCVCVCETRRHS